MRLLHGARRRPTQGACSSLPLALSGGECLPPGPRTCKWLAFVTQVDLMKLGLIEQACGCFVMRGAGRLKVRPRLCRLHSGGECLPPGPHTCNCRWLCLCNGSRHEAPTDRASLSLLHGARQRPTQGACSSLPLALRQRVLAARTSGPHTCRLVCFRDAHRHEALT